jgi:hypothetical protein
MSIIAPSIKIRVLSRDDDPDLVLESTVRAACRLTSDVIAGCG